MRYSIAQQTLTGTRTSNQDRIACSERENSVLMVVADGLGGYEGGELAAQTLMDSVIDFYQNTKSALINDPAVFIVLSITYAHSMIHQRARFMGMDPHQPRTTCVVCLVQNGYAYWGHVGDSRLYLLNESELITRTIDHSTFEMEPDSAPEPRAEHDHALLVRCVGGYKRPLVSLGPETPLATGDILLLCTDGLWRAFDEDQIRKYATEAGVDDSIDKLMSLAERRCKRDCDNLSAVLFRWDDLPSRHPPLLNLAVPELDQERLWQEVKHRPAPCVEKSAGGNGGKVAKGEIESTIQEIESFVKQLDTLL